MCLFVFGFDIVCCIFGIVCSVLILPPSLTGVWFLGFGILPPSSAPKPLDDTRSTRIATFERRKPYQRRQCVTTAPPILGYPAAFTGKYSTFPPIIPHHHRKCHRIHNSLFSIYFDSTEQETRSRQFAIVLFYCSILSCRCVCLQVFVRLPVF